MARFVVPLVALVAFSLSSHISEGKNAFIYFFIFSCCSFMFPNNYIGLSRRLVRSEWKTSLVKMATSRRAKEVHCSQTLGEKPRLKLRQFWSYWFADCSPSNLWNVTYQGRRDLKPYKCVLNYVILGGLNKEQLTGAGLEPTTSGLTYRRFTNWAKKHS